MTIYLSRKCSHTVGHKDPRVCVCVCERTVLENTISIVSGFNSIIVFFPLYASVDRRCGTRCDVLTWEVAPEARLGCDHPLRSGLTKDCNAAFGLLPQSCQSTAKMIDDTVHFIVREPSIVAQDQLTGDRLQRQTSSSFTGITRKTRLG